MSFSPTAHPVMVIPPPAELAVLGAEWTRRYILEREALIDREKKDPLRYGFDPWTFKLADAVLEPTVEGATRLLEAAEAEYARMNPGMSKLGLVELAESLCGHTEILVMGQNRCGKTVWAAKRAIKGLVTVPERLWAVFEASAQASINKQQPMLHQYLPPEWRNVGKEGTTTYVKFTKQNGFSGEKFTLPNVSQCYCFNYKQDTGVFEGYELDGAWFDELVPLAFLEAMEFRLGQDRRFEQIVTFTPVRGYTPTVGRYLAGAVPVATFRATLLPADMVHAKGCPRGHLPLVMQCRNPSAAVVFFPWGSNPFGANEEVKAKLVGASLEKIKIRAYGWTDKMVTGAFPRFQMSVHVISRKRFEELEAKGVTRYISVDPGGAKNWFIKWYAVNASGHTMVYREWPDKRSHGEWALSPGTEKARPWDWRPGPAQRSEAGRGIRGYKELILTLEGWVWDAEKKEWDGSKAEKMEMRVIDPRMGGQVAPSEEEGTSIIELLADEQQDRDGNVIGPAMEFFPAPGSRVDETVQMINDLMEFDEGEPVTVMNCPRWYVVDDCEQSVLAYQEFTGAGTEKDALKDIIDPDRYFVKADLGYVAEGQYASSGGGSY